MPDSREGLAVAAPARAPAARYRPDIDGLRGIAVLAVLAFHAFPGVLPGGHAGVDVFFVISGFLITRLVQVALAEGRFDYGDFLARRIRRLFPALLVVLVVVLVAGWNLLLPVEFRQLGRHVVAGAGFVSNFVLMTEVDYFDNAAATKPLLHLWTLSIEEQFYVAWPALLVLAWRHPGWLRRSTPLLLAASFAAWLLLLPRDPTAAFYLPVTRAWELLAGAALVRLVPAAGQASRLAGWAGLALVLAALALPLPLEGEAWRIPTAVAGSALVISRPVGVAGVLSTRWLVGVGLISYPLYLWHWPLLTFARILSPLEPAVGTRLALLATAFAASYATWRWLEGPVRRNPGGGLRKVWLPLVVPMVLVALLGAATYRQQGFPGRLSGEMASLVQASELIRGWKAREVDIRMNVCHLRTGDIPFDRFLAGNAHCLAVAPDRPNLLVVGDSLGADFRVALAKAYPGVEVLQLTMAGCEAGAAPKTDCGRLNALALDLGRRRPIAAVLFSSRWDTALDDAAIRRLSQTIAGLSARTRVVLVGPPPEFDEQVPALLGRKPPTVDPSTHASRFLTARHDPNIAILRRLARRHGALYFDRIGTYCGPALHCPVTDGEHLFILDYAHLSPQGTDLFADRLKEAGLFPRIRSHPGPPVLDERPPAPE